MNWIQSLMTKIEEQNDPVKAGIYACSVSGKGEKVSNLITLNRKYNKNNRIWHSKKNSKIVNLKLSLTHSYTFTDWVNHKKKQFISHETGCLLQQSLFASR